MQTEPAHISCYLCKFGLDFTALYRVQIDLTGKRFFPSSSLIHLQPYCNYLEWGSTRRPKYRTISTAFKSESILPKNGDQSFIKLG